MKIMIDKILLALTLLQLPSIGRVTTRKIIQPLKAIPETIDDIELVIGDYIERSKNKKFDFITKTSLINANDYAKSILDKSDKEGLNVTYIDDRNNAHWVQNLSNISNPPIVIFTKGSEKSLNLPSITVIGSRKATSFGLKSAEKIAMYCVEEGYCVISGLALGCDISAHKGVLAKNGLTVAILANGLDQITPTKNKAIADQIINTGGCLLSEYPIGSELNRSNYIERNRLQAALGLGLIVVETSLKSGSMHTVSYAKKFDKQIACIDHDESFHHIESVQGNRLLINDGAHPIKDSKELHAFLKIVTKGCKVIKSQNQLEL